MYMGDIRRRRLCCRRRIRNGERWKKLGVKTGNMYGGFGMVAYKWEWSVIGYECKGKKPRVRDNDNSKAGKLKDCGGNGQQETGGDGGKHTQKNYCL